MLARLIPRNCSREIDELAADFGCGAACGHASGFHAGGHEGSRVADGALRSGRACGARQTRSETRSRAGRARTRQRRSIGTGSHIDAIPNAGKYDGVVGVLGGLEAIRALQRDGFRPRNSIELLLFTSEEPTRFGIGCIGSRLLSGTLSPEAARKLKDKDGESVDEVRRAGGDARRARKVALPRGYYKAFVELHIEQGPLLERERVPLGIVTKIAAPASARITIEGCGRPRRRRPDARPARCAVRRLGADSGGRECGAHERIR